MTLNVRYREHELTYMLNQSQARLVLTPNATHDLDFVSFYESFCRQVPTGGHVVFLDRRGFTGSASFNDLTQTSVDPAALAAAATQVSPGQPAAILYTSGTTGAPKGATLTHRSMLASAAAQLNRLGANDHDTYVGTMPFNHVGGITCTITAALLSGAEVIFMPNFTPDGALQIIDRHRATVFAGVPTMYALTLDRADSYDLASVRHAIIGDSNAEVALCEWIAGTFPNARLSNLYGLSESSSACVLSRADDDPETVAITLGVPIGDFEIRVTGPDGQPVQSGEDGELQIRGACVCDGYWQLPDETAATFLPGGWLATGDVVTPEPDGHLVLRGRTKEMFVRGGYNIYPVEVENVLTTHPAVAMAGGIGIPNPVLGETGRYYVVPRAKASPPEQGGATTVLPRPNRRLQSARRDCARRRTPADPAGRIAKVALKQHATQEAALSSHETGTHVSPQPSARRREEPIK